MSVRPSWNVWCDACGDCLNGDLGNVTAGEARSTAKSDGAHVLLPGGRDICGECWSEGKR